MRNVICAFVVMLLAGCCSVKKAYRSSSSYSDSVSVSVDSTRVRYEVYNESLSSKEFEHNKEYVVSDYWNDDRTVFTREVQTICFDTDKMDSTGKSPVKSITTDRSVYDRREGTKVKENRTSETDKEVVNDSSSEITTKDLSEVNESRLEVSKENKEDDSVKKRNNSMQLLYIGLCCLAATFIALWFKKQKV